MSLWNLFLFSPETWELYSQNCCISGIRRFPLVLWVSTNNVRFADGRVSCQKKCKRWSWAFVYSVVMCSNRFCPQVSLPPSACLYVSEYTAKRDRQVFDICKYKLVYYLKCIITSFDEFVKIKHTLRVWLPCLYIKPLWIAVIEIWSHVCNYTTFYVNLKF